eukprot:GDKK01040024.1.p1 GENE.GDKK01040024.1~~GDKK01040024.1.p1  ORF type:complete len:145 (+),score=27.37 GDKK01040024.1:28-462(+)
MIRPPSEGPQIKLLKPIVVNPLGYRPPLIGRAPVSIDSQTCSESNKNDDEIDELYSIIRGLRSQLETSRESISLAKQLKQENSDLKKNLNTIKEKLEEERTESQTLLSKLQGECNDLHAMVEHTTQEMTEQRAIFSSLESKLAF